MNDAARTPVLVGIGTATQREEDFTRALEPMDLMLQAVAAAGQDTGSPHTLRGAQYIAVPRGRWAYANPAGEIARKIGASKPFTVLADVGVMQQTLIGEACARIARGESHTTLVAGGDTGWRILRAQIAKQRAMERVHDDQPDLHLSPESELRHPAEKRAGMKMPVGLYAIMESAFRANKGWTLADHLDRLATLGERCSRIAADNPHAWQRRASTARDIRDASERNPMQAFPYTRLHCSTWNVDQAAALLFCSAARATELGIDRSRWIYPVASTESNFMMTVSARERLHECPGARIAGLAAVEALGRAVRDIDLIDLYSCFPLAIEVYAEALGLPLDRDLTVTGGMPFAGGPYNNYVLQATCRTAELLRAGRGRTALVSSVSGVLTKQGFGAWSTDAGHGFTHRDVTDEVAQAARPLEVLDDYSGAGQIAGFTVLHGRGQEPSGVAVVTTTGGQRTVAVTSDAAMIARMHSEELVGHRVRILDNEMML
jgi:acetyl-CoA C-acetyltransferase